MATIAVLGGAGGVGRVAVETLTHLDEVDDVIVADLDPGAVEAVVKEFDSSKLRAVALDVSDRAALVDLLGGVDVVLNCVGPFYRFGPPTLAAAIEAGVGYVDVCDDLDATRALLDQHDAAQAAGITALVGMGNSPGLANVFVKLCADELLDEVTAVDIFHVHGGEPSEGAGVLKHRIHAMVDDVPLFIDGEFIDVRQLEPSGLQHVRQIDFQGVGTYPAYPYPHPETITLPGVFPTLRRATNLGVVYPLSYFSMTQELVRAGMAEEESLTVGDVEVAPIDVMVALIQKHRPALLAAEGITEPGGCLRVDVTGTVDGAEHTYICSLTSSGAGAGQGTGIPAALGAALHLRGALDGRTGVFPPEAIVPVGDLLTLAGDVVGVMGVASGGDAAGGEPGGAMPLTVEHITPDGRRETVPMGF
ncbi:MAG: saccharopine dehydrogenase family protein [Microthrixaceae bacterium]